ncbi:hypothetical protein EDM76_13795 [bacterium]|nr:MAG: hypothetical protein EDM76_13795 [bacterium]
MTGALWRREFTGGIRPPWRQPWAVPLAAGLWSLLAAAMRWEFPPVPPLSSPDYEYWPRGGVLVVWGPQALLALAMIGIVSWTSVRDRRDPALAMTLIAPREIALAKTFAPTALSLLLITGLAAWEAIELPGPPILTFFFRMGFTNWGTASIDTLGFRPSPLGEVLVRAFLVVRTLLAGLGLVTFTAWVAARSRRSHAAMGIALLAGLLVPGTVLLTEQSLRAHVFPYPFNPDIDVHVTFAQYQAAGNVRAAVHGEAAMILITRLLLPLLWLAWWWRWTRQGFARRHFAGE